MVPNRHCLNAGAIYPLSGGGGDPGSVLVAQDHNVRGSKIRDELLLLLACVSWQGKRSPPCGLEPQTSRFHVVDTCESAGMEQANSLALYQLSYSGRLTILNKTLLISVENYSPP